MLGDLLLGLGSFPAPQAVLAAVEIRGRTDAGDKAVFIAEVTARYADSWLA